MLILPQDINHLEEYIRKDSNDDPDHGPGLRILIFDRRAFIEIHYVYLDRVFSLVQQACLIVQAIIMLFQLLSIPTKYPG